MPIATYGAVLWFGRTSHTIVRKQLLAMQRAFLLIISKACRTTSTSAMQVISGIMPLDLEIVRQGLISSVKHNTTTNWNNYNFAPKEDINDIKLDEEITLINREMKIEWQERWDKDTHGRMTYNFIKTIDFAQNKWFTPSRACTYIITGYGSINSTLFGRGAITDGKCVHCKKEETVRHMLFECDLYKESRYPYLNQGQEDFGKLIKEEEHYRELETFVNNILEDRKSYLLKVVEDSRNGSASSWLRTENGRIN